MGLRKNWGIAGMEPLAVGERRLDLLREPGSMSVAARSRPSTPPARSASLDGDSIEADVLVVALGAERDPEAVPGLSEHALDAYDRDANAQNAAAVDAFAGGRVGGRRLRSSLPVPSRPL